MSAGLGLQQSVNAKETGYLCIPRSYKVCYVRPEYS